MKTSPWTSAKHDAEPKMVNKQQTNWMQLAPCNKCQCETWKQQQLFSHCMQCFFAFQLLQIKSLSHFPKFNARDWLFVTHVHNRFGCWWTFGLTVQQQSCSAAAVVMWQWLLVPITWEECHSGSLRDRKPGLWHHCHQKSQFVNARQDKKRKCAPKCQQSKVNEAAELESSARTFVLSV